jgi:SEC-C motif-containing protein
MSLETNCPCGAGKAFDACCGRFLSGAQFAPTAEELMRSRYSAFALGQVQYLLDSWHPRTRPRSLDLDDRDVWTRLEVLSTTGGGLLDQSGTVEFIAHFRMQKQAGEVHGNSTFERFHGKWYYVAELQNDIS